MANRPVFRAEAVNPFCDVHPVNFTWNAGLSVSQKQKNIRAIHEAYSMLHDQDKVLEISSKSMQEGGRELSAFALEKHVPSLCASLPVEVIYHAGKVFRHGGPYTDLLQAAPREAKRDPRLKESGPLTGFCFEDMRFPAAPITLYYDYLYMNALLENPDLAKVVLQYDAFTDIEFAPQRSISCQAKAAAMFVGLHRAGMEACITDIDALARCYAG